MQVANPSIGQIFIMIWFSISVVVAIAGTFVLWYWLKLQKVDPIFMLIGTPGYLEYFYVKWCRSHGRHPKTVVIVFRALSLISAIVAGILLILFVLPRE